MEQNQKAPTERAKIKTELIGTVLIFSAVALFLALYSFDKDDFVPLLQTAGGHATTNKLGFFGAFVAGYLREIFGLPSFVLPVFLVWPGVKKLFPFVEGMSRRRWSGLWGLLLTAFLILGSDWFDPIVRFFKSAPSAPLHEGLAPLPGGLLGAALNGRGVRLLSPVGMYLFVTLVALVSVQLFLGLSWKEQAARAKNAVVWLWNKLRPRIGRVLFGRRSSWSEDEAAPPDAQAKDAPEFDPGEEEEEPEAPVAKPPEKAAPQPPKAKSPETSKKPVTHGNGLPPLSLLTAPPAQAQGPSEDFLISQAESLTKCLQDFGVEGEVVDVATGPVVIMYEIKPARGVKVSRILGLANDIALAMKALAVRIEAPIPGRDTVGVELPNSKRQTVYLRDILESDAFAKSASPLTLSIGKNIQGNPFVADLARMPHLLVAGATGSGKSVCINGIILSILYKTQPDEVKLLLIDPKRIELAMYADLPHLAHPVVTDMTLAKSALEWCVAEMDRRYEAMARLGVRNIDGYNEKVAKLSAAPSPDTEIIEPMPYLVLIIDELADLMMTAAKDVEIAIVRLAQLARASGIHMILATQRPSVDVVTGLIKANFPTRIAFQVTSGQDSRTILDTVGAERLLGRGDMLFKPSGAKMTRMHGAFVSDEESSRVVQYWKDRQAPSYLVDLTSWADESGGEGESAGSGADQESLSDPIYPQALEFVMEQGKASISLIQRRFRIGFNRAARFIEQMEREGLLGPADGSKPRTVLKGRE